MSDLIHKAYNDTVNYDGDRTIEILVKDKETGKIMGARKISRAALAKYMRPLTDNPVTAHDGRFVVEF